jgi:internalin A
LAFVISWLGIACARDLGGGPGAGVDCQPSDPNLAAAAREAAMAGNVAVREVANLSAVGVNTLDGVQCLEGLVSLSLQSDRELDLSPLTGHPGLSSLNIQEVPLTSLASLGGMPALTVLYARGTRIASLQNWDVQPKLATLDLGGTPVTTLDLLFHFAPNLRTLYVDGSALATLEAGDFPHGLTFLAISRTAIGDLRPIAALPLVTLSARQTAVADLTPLRRNLELGFVDVAQSSVTSLAPLSGTFVRQIYAENNALTSLADVLYLGNLRHLRLDGNAIADMTPLTALTHPAWLEVRGNPLDGNAPGVFQSLCDAGWAVDWDGGRCGNPCLFESCTLALLSP